MGKAGVYVKSKTAVAALVLRDAIWKSIIETADSDGKIDLGVALEAVHDILGSLLKWMDDEDVDGIERPAFKLDSPEQWITNPGESMRKWRKHNQMTLSDVSKLTQISVSHLSALEHGKIMPSLKTLHAILDVVASVSPLDTR